MSNAEHGPKIATRNSQASLVKDYKTDFKVCAYMPTYNGEGTTEEKLKRLIQNSIEFTYSWLADDAGQKLRRYRKYAEDQRI